MIAIITACDRWKTEKTTEDKFHFCQRKNRNEQTAHYVPGNQNVFRRYDYRITLLL